MPRKIGICCDAVVVMLDVIAVCVISDVLMKMPYVDGELPVYWWDSEADRCMVIGIFRHGTCVSRVFHTLSVVDVFIMTSN